MRPAGHPDLYVYQQDGPGGQRPLRAVRGAGKGTGHRHLRHQLAHRLRQGISGGLRPAETTDHSLYLQHQRQSGYRYADRAGRPGSGRTHRGGQEERPDGRDRASGRGLL